MTMTIQKSKITDHQLAQIIKGRDMKRNDKKESENVNYYHNDNYTIEILVIFDNSNNTRSIYISE